MLNGNRIIDIKNKLKRLDEEEFYLEMADVQSEIEKKRLRDIRKSQRELRIELKKLSKE